MKAYKKHVYTAVSGDMQSLITTAESLGYKASDHTDSLVIFRCEDGGIVFYAEKSNEDWWHVASIPEIFIK